jgi:hypothetical protein
MNIDVSTLRLMELRAKNMTDSMQGFSEKEGRRSQKELEE